MFALVVTWSITGTYRVANKNVTMHGYQVKLPILIIARASGDESAAKYSEMSAILGVLSHIWPP